MQHIRSLRNATEPSLQSHSVPARVIESALDVGRAELALLMVHVREVAIRGIAALLATILGAAFAQVALVFLVVAPVLSQHMSTPRVGLAIGIPALLALGCGWAARAAWRGIPRQSPAASPADDAWPDPRPAS
jgi:uncharacterized membrane protein